MPVAHHPRRWNRSQALAELAVLTPLLLLMLLGVAQIGVLFYSASIASSVARNAALAATTTPVASGAFTQAGGTAWTSCLESPSGNPACISASSSMGPYDMSAFTSITVYGSSATGGSLGSPTLCPSSREPGYDGSGSGNAYVTVHVTLDAPIFIPLFGTLFVNAAHSTHALAASAIARVAPCSITELEDSGS